MKSYGPFIAAFASLALSGCGTVSSPTPIALGHWIWMGGANTVNQSGSYGTRGTPASTNIPPTRWNAVNWTDRSGNFWLFGGYTYDATTNATGVLLNDLWEFNPTSNQWTWIGGSSTLPQNANGWPGVYGTLGVPAATNIPGSRAGAAAWVDDNGNFWLFGGNGENDLWQYSPSSNEWTWIGGSDAGGASGTAAGIYGTLGVAAFANNPGGRSGAISWSDHAGNFWLFGGNGIDANNVEGYLNDLWEYNPSTNEWTWMGGSSTVGPNGGHSGIYGSLAAPALGNIPGGRFGGVSWTDGSGNQWLLGGSGYDANSSLTALNDLWEFRSSTNEWAWMEGSTSSVGCTTYNLGLVICRGQPGIYGALGTSAVGNIPGGRSGAVSWIDGSGDVWLFGGQGYDSADNEGNLNDIWKFNPQANEWTWMGGNTTASGCGILPEGNIFCAGRSGVYGALGQAGSGNAPGGRFGASSWADNKGNLWLFGGYGTDSTGHTMGVLNDLWEYQP